MHNFCLTQVFKTITILINTTLIICTGILRNFLAQPICLEGSHRDVSLQDDDSADISSSWN